MLSTVTTLAAEAEHGESTLMPYAVGGAVLAILLLALLGLLVFGAGREHS